MGREWYIIRHGETELNRLGIVQGRGVNSDLNDTGRAQAAAFFAQYRDVPFDHIYTSTLKRTHQTVQGFIDRSIPWTSLPGLDELAWGQWEGKPNTEEALHAFRSIAEQWQQGDYTAKFEGGESPEDVLERLKTAVAYIRQQTDEHCILVCMHGRAMRLLLCYLLGKPLSEMGDFPHQNTTLYRLREQGAHFEIIDFNHAVHLNELP